MASQIKSHNSKWLAVLIRHGDYHQLADTPSAHQPFALNNKGRQQAIDCVERIRQMLDELQCQLSPLIHSSNLLRAWQTASIIKQGFAETTEIKGFDELAERGLGSAANLTVSQIEKVLQEDPRFENPPADWKSNSHYCLPLQGAESLMDAGKRVASHIVETCAQAGKLEQDTAQVFVGHGAAIRHAAYHLGVLEFEQIKKLSMYHATPVVIAFENNQWHQLAGQWKVRRQNTKELD